MTIIPPLPPYVPPYGTPVPTVTPFTFRDGVSYEQKFERLVKYFNRVVIPFINTNVPGLAEAFTTEVNRLITEVNAALEAQSEGVDEALATQTSTVNSALTAQDAEVDQKILDLTNYVNAAIAAIEDSSIEVQDPIVAALVADIDSDTRQALNLVFQPLNTVSDTAVKNHVIDEDSETRTALDLIYQAIGTVDDSAIAAWILDDDSETYQALVGIQGNTIAEDSVSEWWCHPVATALSDPYERTVFGGVSSDGIVQICEFNHATKTTTKIPVGTVAVDDHNAPAVYAEKGKRIVMAWTNHNRDDIVRIRVGGGTADIASLQNAATINISIGVGASYTQIHKINHKSNEYNTCLWIFTRKSTDGWGYIEANVDQRTGAIETKPYRSVVESPGRQCYISVADAFRPDGFNQVLRVGWGYNPAQPVHSVYYMEIDVVTEKIGSPVQPSWQGTLGTPIVDNTTTLQPLLPTTAAGWSRRFFYVRPGPDLAAVAYADWNETTPDEATYYQRELTSGGQLLPAGGYLFTPADKIPAFSSGFQVSCLFDLPVSFSGNIGLASMYGTAGTNTFFLRLTTAGDIEFAVYDTAGTAYPFHTATAPLSSYMVGGATLGVRVTIDLVELIVRRYISLDSGKSWQMIGTGTVISGASALVTNGIRTAGRDSFKVPYAAGGTDFGKVNVRSFSLKSRTGLTEYAGMSFVRGECLGLYDTHGLAYTVSGSASIGAPTWRTDAFGIAGPQLEGDAPRNYIAGMAFECPSANERVITAHSIAGTERIKVWNNVSGVYGDKDILVEPTSEGRRARPIAPVGGRIDRIGHTNFLSYGPSYTTYEGNWEVINY